MKKAGQWKNRMVLALELPPDLAYNETIVTLTGQTEAVFLRKSDHIREKS